MRWIGGLFVLVAVAMLAGPPAGAEDRGIRRAAKAAEARTALVIGNGAYESSPLANPGNDARSMSRVLAGLGFEVQTLVDGDQKQMRKAIVRFGRALKQRGGVGLFYYAGHGMQVQGENFLIPIAAAIEAEEEVAVESVSTDYVLARMDAAHNRLNVVILDACRNNPFARSFRSGARGLASMNAPAGTLVAYATAPGNVAADGDGENGLYTGALVEAMQVPGRRIEDVFKQVRARVQEDSAGRQVPWESSSLTGDFFFREGAAPRAGAPPRTASAPQSSAPATSAPAAPVDMQVWNSIKGSTDPNDFETFLGAYPDSPMAPFAKNRLKALSPKKVAKAGPSSIRAAKTARSGPGLLVDKPVYSSGERVTLRYFGLPGNSQDWITVVPEGAAEDQWGDWTYTKGKREGTWSTGPLEPGRYEARLYFDWPRGQFTVHGRRKFRVEN